MKTIAAFLLLTTAVFGAGNVQQSAQQVGNSSVWVVSMYWTGDSITGSVPATLAKLPGPVQGYRIVAIETAPGSPAPTSGYSAVITDSLGLDLMGGQTASLSSTQAATYTGASPIPLFGSFTLTVSSSTAGGKGKVLIYLAPMPDTIGITSASSNSLSYTANGSNTVSTVQAALRRLGASPQDFGASCNGLADDYIPLQAWLASSPNIYLPPGTCTTGTTLHITISHQRLTGTGTIKAHSGLSGAIIQVDAFTEINGPMTFDGNSIASPVMVMRCAGVSKFHGFTVTGSAGDGIYFHSALTAPASTDCPAAGNNDHGVFENVRTIFNNGNGINFAAGDQDDSVITWIGGQISQNGLAGGAGGLGTAGIYVTPSGVVASGWTLINASFTGNWGYAWDLEASGSWRILNPSWELNNYQGGGSQVAAAAAKDAATNNLYVLNNWTTTTCTANLAACPIYMTGTAIVEGLTAAGVLFDVAAGSSRNGFQVNYRGADKLHLDDTGNPFFPVLGAQNSSTGGQVIVSSSGLASAVGLQSFTPVLAFGGNSVGIDYSVQSGTYHTAGHLTEVQVNLTLRSKGSSTGAATITGLPVTVSGSSNGTGSAGYTANMSSLTSTPSLFADGGGTTIQLFETGSGGSASLSDANFTNTSQIQVTMVYQN